VTVPLGVLKAGSIRFQPPLPPRKQDAIARMGFGILNKVSRDAVLTRACAGWASQALLHLQSSCCS
jgi:Flavin containing amine oxidoreductase